MLFVGFFAVSILIRACQHPIASGDSAALAVDTTFTDFFNGLCIIGFAFCGQTAVFPVLRRVLRAVAVGIADHDATTTLLTAQVSLG